MSNWLDEKGKITRKGKFAIVTYTLIGALFVISVIDHISKDEKKEEQSTKTNLERNQSK